MTELKELIGYWSQAGLTAGLIVAVVGFVRGWIVAGTIHDRVLKERDDALKLAASSVEASKETADVLARLTDVIRRDDKRGR